MLGTSPYAPYELMPMLFHSVEELCVDENLAQVDSNAEIAVSSTTEQDQNTTSGGWNSDVFAVPLSYRGRKQRFYMTNRYRKDNGFKQMTYMSNHYANDPAFRAKQ